MLGNTVYYSVLGRRVTLGLNVATGRPVFSFKDGAFTPTIADYHAIYLVGYASVYQLLPRTHKARRKATHKKSAKPTHKTTRRGPTRRSAGPRPLSGGPPTGGRPSDGHGAPWRARRQTGKSAATQAKHRAKQRTKK